MRLDSFSKSFLSYLNAQENPASTCYEFSDLSNLANAMDCKDVEIIRSAVKYLHEKDYLTYSRDSNGKECAFYLSYRGMHWEEISKNELYETLFKSVLLPIIASIATSAIVSICAYLWTMAGISNP